MFHLLFISKQISHCSWRKAVRSRIRCRTGHLPSTLDLVFSKYINSIHSINHLAPLGKSDHATLQVNFAVSALPAGNLSKPKWRYNKANAQGLLCAANGIDWASISQMAHVNDQWCHSKKSILLLQHRFVPFSPVSRRRTLPWLRSKHKRAHQNKHLAFAYYKGNPPAYTFKVYRDEPNKFSKLTEKSRQKYENNLIFGPRLN